MCRRFERWRNGHKARLPIPNALSRAAAEAAREHGVFRAAKTLCLDYTKLKRVIPDTDQQGVETTTGEELARQCETMRGKSDSSDRPKA